MDGKLAGLLAAPSVEKKGELWAVEWAASLVESWAGVKVWWSVGKMVALRVDGKAVQLAVR